MRSFVPVGFVINPRQELDATAAWAAPCLSGCLCNVLSVESVSFGRCWGSNLIKMTRAWLGLYMRCSHDNNMQVHKCAGATCPSTSGSDAVIMVFGTRHIGIVGSQR